MPFHIHSITTNQATILVAGTPMKKLPLDLQNACPAPDGPALAAYDEDHALTCVRMLDAIGDGRV